MTTEIVFYTNPRSRGRIVRWMLEELAVPYRTEILEYGPPMKSAEYLAVNPMGKVPAIRHGPTVVTEAPAICAYLADAFPRPGWRRRPGSAAPITAGCSSPPGRSKPQSPTAISASPRRRTRKRWWATAISA